jgi:hypothetical protein
LESYYKFYGVSPTPTISHTYNSQLESFCSERGISEEIFCTTLTGTTIVLLTLRTTTLDLVLLVLPMTNESWLLLPLLLCTLPLPHLLLQLRCLLLR